jgi:plastocyanin
MKKIAFSLVAATILLLAFGTLMSGHAITASSQPNHSSEAYQIYIDNFSFAPATLSVPVGAKVTWTNKDDVPHTIVSTNNAFAHSPVLDTDESFSHTFATAGTYEYYCSVHPKMLGKVIVQ